VAMKPAATSPRPSPESLRGIPYENTKAAEPPIPITTATSAPQGLPQKGANPLRRPKTVEQLAPQKTRSRNQDDPRRDSGLAPSSFTARDSRTTLGTDVDSTPSVRPSSSNPAVLTHDSKPSSPLPNERKSTGTQSNGQLEHPAIPQLPFMNILTENPTGSFEDLTIPGKVEFSKRGSMLIGGKKANDAIGGGRLNGGVIGSRRQPNTALLQPSLNVPARILSADDEALSNKVRSMYEDGRGRANDAATGLDSALAIEKMEENCTAAEIHPTIRLVESGKPTMNGSANHDISPVPTPPTNQWTSNIMRGDTELAGGIEDWENVDGEDVDRYGFIRPKKLSSNTPSMNSGRVNTPDPPRLQRMSTLLQIASEAPRRQRSRRRKANSSKSPARSAEAVSTSRPWSGVMRPTSSQSSYRSTNTTSSRMRTAANRLPHNKNRRCVDEAGDMLTLPPGLADIAEDEEDSKVADDLRRREWEREEKWRKMAKIVKNEKHGGGMVFEFDTKHPKVIERTWKGIPDRWRATAWHAFLTASAKKRRGSPSDDDLKVVFQRLLDQGSPDDVQIDIDVPRTINSHIMFRRRYRGGQRLLFRVLHCMSIYFPDTGYVQGMAALAATLLCYFDEEMTFVMLVRLWQLRGLERLYQSGFEGLMQALEQFEKNWLGKGEVAAKLVRPSLSFTSLHDFLLYNQNISLTSQTDRPQHPPHLLRNPLVPNPLQLLHPLPRPTPRLGRLHPTRRPRNPLPTNHPLRQSPLPIHTKRNQTPPAVTKQ